MDTAVELLEDLARLALFEGLARDELEAIVESCDEASFGEGEWIIREGDPRSAPLHDRRRAR